MKLQTAILAGPFRLMRTAAQSGQASSHPLQTFAPGAAVIRTRLRTRAEKAASRIAVILKRLGSSTYDVAIKIIADIGSATVKKMLGL